MGRRYEFSPITEAICLLRFSPDSGWDMTMPGAIYEGLKGKFPNRKQKPSIEIELVGPQLSATQKMQSVDLVQFYDSTECSLVQVGKHLISINRLSPYESWGQFKPDIENAYRTYCEVASPKRLLSIGLRYINRMNTKSSVVDFEEFFNFRPNVDVESLIPCNKFVVGTVASQNEGRDEVKVVLSDTDNPEDDGLAATLDIDYTLANPEAVTLGDAMQWVEDAHTFVEEVFENCITDKMRALFGHVSEV